ncbi:MAG TPA: MarR family transcriptional regulator [Acidimicrobiales bacterium]|jgi:MarR family 2-MHQ and catechol resistance regulon transcriptional repressor|nr:MarR family transcriptional regulator [Acidimicrobiales bacterium]
MDSLTDDRLTLAGLFIETHAGLVSELGRHLEAESGLTNQWFEILLRLARSPGGRLRMTDLARQVVITPSGLTRSIDRMEEAGMVRREACSSDRRVFYAVLTPKGRRRIEGALPRHIEHIDECFTAHLDPKERTALESALRKLRAALRPDSEAGVAT